MNRFQADRSHGPPHSTDNNINRARATGHDEQVPEYSIAEAERDITSFSKAHTWDPNIGNEKLDAMGKAITNSDTEAEISIQHEIIEDSPYPEVQAAVQTFDDPTIPANTLRAWFLGLLFVTIGSGLNVLFSLRDPSISIGTLVIQLCVYPVGVFMAKVLPTRQFSFFGKKFSFNPGPFNKKEHTLIVIMANVAFANGAGRFFLKLYTHPLTFTIAYSTLTIEAQRGFVSAKYLNAWSSRLTD